RNDSIAAGLSVVSPDNEIPEKKTETLASLIEAPTNPSQSTAKQDPAIEKVTPNKPEYEDQTKPLRDKFEQAQKAAEARAAAPKPASEAKKIKDPVIALRNKNISDDDLFAIYKDLHESQETTADRETFDKEASTLKSILRNLPPVERYVALAQYVTNKVSNPRPSLDDDDTNTLVEEPISASDQKVTEKLALDSDEKTNTAA